MASIIRPAWRAASRVSTAPRLTFSPRLRTSFSRSYSDAAAQSPPPLMTRIRGDLKIAMKAKDTRRLNVVRAIISTYNEFSRSDKPVSTDPDIVAILRKANASAQDAIEEFSKAGRQDLVDQEKESVGIIMEYIETSGVPILDEAGVEAVVKSVVAEIEAEGQKPNFGIIMKKLKAANGPLQGKDYDIKTVQAVVKKQTA